MKTTKKYQHNGEFEQLLDAKLDLLEMAYREAETAEAKAEVLKNYGFDIHEFYLSAIRKRMFQPSIYCIPTGGLSLARPTLSLYLFLREKDTGWR